MTRRPRGGCPLARALAVIYRCRQDTNEGVEGYHHGDNPCFAKDCCLSAPLIVVSAPVARADLCFSYKKTGGGILVAQGATLPATNLCQPLAMYEAGGLIGAATGSICQDGFGDNTIVFHYTYDGCTSNYFKVGDLPPPITAGRQPPHNLQHLPDNNGQRGLLP